MQSKDIIARNILILEQLKEVAKAFKEQNIDVILLKGVAMTALFPGYIKERVMEDIDLLVRESDIIKAKKTLISLGYKHGTNDPWAFIQENKLADIDLCCNLWYLDNKENLELWYRAIPVNTDNLNPNVYTLLPVDMFVHIVAHSTVHHCEKYPSVPRGSRLTSAGHVSGGSAPTATDWLNSSRWTTAGNKWEKDLKLIEERYNLDSCTIREVLKKDGLLKPFEIYLNDGNSSKGLINRFYSFMFRNQLPNRGHILRFIFLPLRKKLIYLCITLFPTNDFIKDRYNLKNIYQVTIYRFLRILSLLSSLLVFTNNALNYLFSGSNQPLLKRKIVQPAARQPH